MPPSHDTIAGVPVPDSRIAREATELVRDVSTPLLFDHSRRVFLWGSLHGEQLALDYDPELLYVGAMFHDLGLVEGHRSRHERFEIEEGILEALAGGIRDKPETAYATWQRDILEATVPDYVPPNFCDVVRQSRFAT